MNKIFCGDNLEILKTLESESVDLCYIDPPFFTQKDWGEFNDRFESMENYIEFMRLRIIEIHRILKTTGSFYLHCDKNANAYLKVMCDKVFGYNNFINEIIWIRTTAHKGTKGEPRKYGHNTDTIFFYSKSKKYDFKIPRAPLSITQLERDYKCIEPETQRCFSHAKMNKTKGPKSLYFADKDVKLHDSIGFRWTQETLNMKLKENPNCLYWTKNGNPRMKIYLDEHKGVPLNNFLDDINICGGKEDYGYPTQKPEELLERIIKASSNKGDVVLDAFCGSGTTITVAQKLERQFIGIDQNPNAIKLTQKRIKQYKTIKKIDQWI